MAKKKSKSASKKSKSTPPTQSAGPKKTLDEKKFEILKSLDDKTDWVAVIKNEMLLKEKAELSKATAATGKLTKGQKKQRKLELQKQAVQEALKKKNVETVVFTNPDTIIDQQERQVDTLSAPDSKSNETGIEIDMRKTRFEIMKFGMNSLKSKDLEDAEAALAVSLGAKPKKRVGVNYKEFQTQRKKEREQEREQAESSIKPRLNVGMKKPAKKGSRKGKEDKKEMGGRSVGRKSNNNMPRKRNK